VCAAPAHDPAAVTAALAGLPVGFAHAADYAAGMAASLKTAIAAVPDPCAGVLVCLGDMPTVRPDTLDGLIAAFTAAVTAIVPTWQGTRGNPVLLGRALFPLIAALAGDQGARRLLGGPGILELPVDDPGILQDFDSPEALACST
jgi:molybdenum cofactor cytidylyltransferase